MKEGPSISFGFHFLCELVLVLGLGVSVAHASVTGSISGTVTDPTGSLIPGAAVVAVNSATGVRQPTETNSQGFYSLPELPVGPSNLMLKRRDSSDTSK